MVSQADEDYLDSLSELSESYEKELDALKEGIIALDASQGASGQAAAVVAKRIQVLGEQARNLVPPPMFAESHAVYLRGVDEFDLAMAELLDVTARGNMRITAPDLIRRHFDEGMRLVGESTALLYRLVQD